MATFLLWVAIGVQVTAQLKETEKKVDQLHAEVVKLEQKKAEESKKKEKPKKKEPPKRKKK